MSVQKPLEIRVSIGVGCYQHAVAVGLSTGALIGALIDEFEMDHNQVGFDSFFEKIHTIETQYMAPVSIAMEG
jgi:hypothetical protein